MNTIPVRKQIVSESPPSPNELIGVESVFRLGYDASSGFVELFVDGVSKGTKDVSGAGNFGALCLGTGRSTVVTSPLYDATLKDVTFIQNGSTVLDCPIDDGEGTTIQNNGTGGNGFLDNANESQFWYP